MSGRDADRADDRDNVASVTMCNLSIISVVLLAAAALPASEFPEATISNGALTVKLFLPDAQRGYYRGTRFDWSGQIASLKTANHEYFGKWFEKYDPQLHDAIMGPVEEFLTPTSSTGYDEAPVGGTFVRIGVGSVRKPDDKPYQRFRTYEIIDPGRWTIRPGRKRIEFEHELVDAAGYAYRYTKIVRLDGNKPEMVIEHRLRNTGRLPLETQQYNHNFFVIDGEPTGPQTNVEFPFELKPVKPFSSNFAELRDGKLVYTAELPAKQSVFSEFEGFGSTAKDYDVRVENRKAGAGVRIQGSLPIEKLIFWSIRTTVCPEPYVKISVEPGKEQKWTYRYTFYDLPPAR